MEVLRFRSLICLVLSKELQKAREGAGKSSAQQRFAKLQRNVSYSANSASD